MTERDYRFGGTVGTTVVDSDPWWPPIRRPPRSAPNIVMVVLDDVGFGQVGCFGGDIATPTIDALAADGLSYRNFHVTALCSPTRASLLTGRNHHAAGMGLVSNFDNGFPGYRGYVSHQTATLAEILHDAGYVNWCVGKWHLAPPRHCGPLGPFDHWPLGRGFDRYYGFLGGLTNQWSPTLWCDNHLIETPTRAGYHLSEDLADRSIEYLADYVSANTARPFFLYLSLAAGHDPHHAPADHVARYAGSFGDGWDVARERIFGRQLELGIVPDGTVLPEPNPGVAAWVTLGDDEQRLFARMQEVYAGFLSHADEQVGRVVEFLRTHDLLDDTLVAVLSDNGASMEGGRYGYVTTPFRSGRFPTLEDNLPWLDELGGPRTWGMYPTGWAQAGNTPLRYYKMHTHGGGIRAPLVVHWPARLRGTKGVCGQYHHVVDVVPTILEELGLESPTTYRGVPQLPVHGTSMSYTFDDPAAPTTKRVQYYEINGHRGLWRDGWKAVARHQSGTPFSADRWELYDVENDFSESVDLADENPDLLEALVAEWWAEAGANSVLPLEDRTVTIKGNPAAEPVADKREFTFLAGAVHPDSAVDPDLFNRNFRITALVEGFESIHEGVLLCIGDRFCGFTLFMQDGRLVFDYNASGAHSVLATQPLAAGASTLGAVIETLDARRAEANLLVDGSTLASGVVSPVMIFGVGMTGLRCGRDQEPAVSDHYEGSFEFTGSLRRVVVELEPKADDADIQAFAQVMRDQ